MKISQILKEKQPKEYDKLNKKAKKNKNQEHFSDKDIKKLMMHSYYKRTHGGALKQIK